MKKKDMILILVILLIAVASYGIMTWMQKDGKTVVVTIDGKEVFSASLDEEQTYEIPVKGHENVIKIADGQVTMTKADCPDQICKNHKAISKSGETIVCLPHKVVVEIKSETDDNELDGITS